MIQMSQTERAKFRVFKGPHALDVKFLFHYKEGQSADMAAFGFCRTEVPSTSAEA